MPRVEGSDPLLKISSQRMELGNMRKQFLSDPLLRRFWKACNFRKRALKRLGHRGLPPQTFTSGTFGTEPRRGGVSLPSSLPGDLPRRADGRRFDLAGCGIFSGFGVIGPSG